MIQKASDNVMVKLNDVSSNVVLQPIIQAFVDIQSFQDNLEGLLQANASNDRIVQELDEYIKKYKRINPHQQIANHASQWKLQQLSLDAMASLLTQEAKAWGTEFSRLPQTHVTERFYDSLAIKIAEGGAFWLKCYSVKEEISKGSNFKYIKIN